MDSLDILIIALDKDMPGWQIDYADAQDQKNYIQNIQRIGIQEATDQLKVTVANRLFRIVNACVTHGLVTASKDF